MSKSIFSSPPAQAVLIYGGLGLAALFILPRILPQLVRVGADAVGNLAGATVDATGELAGRAIRGVNPANTGNVFYRGVNAIGRGASADSNFTLGGWLYDLTHPEYNPNQVTVPRASGVDAGTVKRN